MNEDLTKKDSIKDLLVENKLAKIENDKLILSDAGVIILTIAMTELLMQLLMELLKKE